MDQRLAGMAVMAIVLIGLLTYSQQRTLLELKLSFKNKFCMRPSKTRRMSSCGDRLGRPR